MNKVITVGIGDEEAIAWLRKVLSNKRIASRVKIEVTDVANPKGGLPPGLGGNKAVYPGALGQSMRDVRGEEL